MNISNLIFSRIHYFNISIIIYEKQSYTNLVKQCRSLLSVKFLTHLYLDLYIVIFKFMNFLIGKKKNYIDRGTSGYSSFLILVILILFERCLKLGSGPTLTSLLRVCPLGPIPLGRPYESGPTSSLDDTTACPSSYSVQLLLPSNPNPGDRPARHVRLLNASPSADVVAPRAGPYFFILYIYLYIYIFKIFNDFYVVLWWASTREFFGCISWISAVNRWI